LKRLITILLFFSMATELPFVASTLHTLIQIESSSTENSEKEVKEEYKEYVIIQHLCFLQIGMQKAYTSKHFAMVAYPFLSYQSPPPDSQL